MIAFASCHVREAPTIQDSNAEAENVIRFDVQARDDAPVRIEAKAVQVSPDRGTLIFKFNKVSFARAATETHDINPGKMTVRIYAHAADQRLQLVRESDGESVLKFSLSSAQPVLEWEPAFEQRLQNVGSTCEKGCLVVATLHYFGDGEAESAPTELRLMTGTGVIASRNAEEDPCRWLSAAEASAIVGTSMKYREPGSGDCTLEPESGKGSMFYYTVFDRPTGFNRQALGGDAQNVTVTDHAVWLPRSATLWAVRGQRMLGLRMGPPGAPPAATPELLKKAEAIARAIVGKM